jgi:hypothetical protein
MSLIKVQKRNIKTSRTTTIDINVVDNKVKDTEIEAGFNPDLVIVEVSVALTPSTIEREPLVDDYTNRLKVYDANGLECHPTREIFTALGVSSEKKFSRDEQRLKDSTFRDTGELRYEEGVDYIAVTTEDSSLMAMGMNALEQINDQCDANEENGEPDKQIMVSGGEATHGGQGRTDTVWTTDATKRIALSSNTEAGVRYANELVTLEHQHGTGSTDIIEHLAELGTGAILTLPNIPIPEDSKRVEDAIRDSGERATHQEACMIGRLSKRVSEAGGGDIHKVNSSKYPNAFVNAYKKDIVDGVTSDVLNPEK